MLASLLLAQSRTAARQGLPAIALVPSLSAATPGAQQPKRMFHVRYTIEINRQSKKGVVDASFELKKLCRDDGINNTGKERRIKPTQERVMREEMYAYQIEKKARKKIIKYIMSQLEARKKGEE